MGSFTCCLVRTAPINATIIINDYGSILSAAALGWLHGVGEPVCWGNITHSLFGGRLLLPHCGNCWNKAEGGQSVLGVSYFFFKVIYLF